MAGTVIEYLQKYGDISFREKPLNDVDSLALRQRSYLKFDGMGSDVRHNGPSVTLREIAERPDVDKLFGDVRFEKENRALFEGTLCVRRFRDMKLYCFINLVDYDMLYGHRRDVDGYAKALAYFDEKLPELQAHMKPDDILMITADHGCDPAYTATTDHTREYTPFLMYGAPVTPGNRGTRPTFSDIGATVLDYFGIQPEFEGSSFLKADPSYIADPEELRK